MLTKFKSILPVTFLILIIFVGVEIRTSIILNKIPASGDYHTHLKAVEDLLTGKNPYDWTIDTFNNLQNDPNNKGYSYFPGIMYTNAIFYTLYLLITQITSMSIISPHRLFLLPGLISNIFIVLFFIKYFKIQNTAKTNRTSGKVILLMSFCTALWLFNPYFTLNLKLAKSPIASYDAIPIALLLWALYYLERDDVLSSVLFTLSIIFKTFPIILFPVFFLKSKNKINFVLSGIIVGIFVSLPFLKSIEDFKTYITGALLVQGERFVQGRPLLYYISYYYHVELFRIIPFKAYSLGAIFSGWVLSIFMLFFKKLKFMSNKYVISVIPFLSFYILTPVLNRTYLLWGYPLFIVGTYKLFNNTKYKYMFYALTLFYWVFYYWYLAQWKDGFHIWHPI